MTKTSSRENEVAAFYADAARPVQRAVASRVSADAVVIEDACQYAWVQLLRRDDVTLDAGGARWLVTVAVREAWRMASPRDQPAGAFRGPSKDDFPDELAEPESVEPGPAEQALTRCTHEQRAADFAALRPVERRELLLLAAGYSYREICEVTGSSRGAVNRRISEGRAKLARLARERCERLRA